MAEFFGELRRKMGSGISAQAFEPLHLIPGFQKKPTLCAKRILDAECRTEKQSAVRLPLHSKGISGRTPGVRREPSGTSKQQPNIGVKRDQALFIKGQARSSSS